MAQRDPFYAVKDKVQTSLTGLRETIQRADSILQSGGQLTEIEPVLSQARTDMSQIHIDVKDLSQTITIVEENRTRFPSIDNRELDSRRAFVTDAKTSLAQFDEQIKRINSKATLSQNKRKQILARNTDDGLGSSSRFGASMNDEASRGNDDFVAASRQQAQLHEKAQDEVLIDMSVALDRLGAIGEDINRELVTQEHELNEVEAELDQAKGTMDVVLKKMDKLLKTSDKGRLCLIVILFIIAIALFFGIVYG